MRLVVNLRPMIPGRTGGAEVVVRSTIESILTNDHDVKLTLLTSYHNHHTFSGWRPRARLVYVPEERRKTLIPAVLANHDVCWTPFPSLEPEQPSVPTAVTIPDLQHLDHSEFFSREMLAQRLRGFRIAATRSTRIFTPSRYSKDHLLAYFRLPEERVEIVPHACSPEFFADRDPRLLEMLRRRYGLPEVFGFYPANNWGHKNHRTLFQALAAYRKEYGETIDLVLAGATVAGGVDLLREADRTGVAEHVRHVGYVERSHVSGLYDCAAFLVFPSLFEGFGLPLLEAMARGTPVISSDRTCLPELAGEAGTFVAATCADSWARAMREVVTGDPAVLARAARGPGVAAGHTYDRVAAQTVTALRRMRRDGATPTRRARRRKARVFIVTPSLNQGQYLRAAIDSVLGQDHPVEFMVADGGSADDSVAILKSYGHRVRWVSAPDGGQAAAVADAWQSTDAEIVGWLNSDDTLLEGAVSAAVDFLDRRPELAMVYGRAWYTDDEGRPTEPYPTRPFDAGALGRDCFICQPATFIRREVFRVVDLPDARLRYCMDYDLWIRLSQFFEIGYLDRFLATSRIHPATKTLSERQGVYRETLRMLRNHFGSIPRTWTAGYFAYRAGRILDRCRWMVPRPVQRSIYNAVMSRRQIHLPSAPYPDGWVSRRTVHHVRLGADGWVTVFADSPHWPYREPLVIDLVFEGSVLARHTATGRGSFRIQAQVPGRRLVPIALELVASRAYVPRRHGLGEDRRTVAFRVRSIQAGRPPAGLVAPDPNLPAFR